MYDRAKVLDEGMRAALDDVPVVGCPYPVGSPECEIWLDGWSCATDDPSPPDPVLGPERVPFSALANAEPDQCSSSAA
jgi:hypothetical protein